METSIADHKLKHQMNQLKATFGFCIFSFQVNFRQVKPNLTDFQGWIQTSATSFQKLVRIVKKFKNKKTESHARKSQPLDANSSQVFNYRIC